MNEPEPNPFRPPQDPPRHPAADASGMSIENEPHFFGSGYEQDASERTAGFGLDPLGGPPTIDDEMEHGIWDEPAFRANAAGNIPAAAVTYERWLDEGVRETTGARSAIVGLLLALLSGPWAVVATLVSQFGSEAAGVGSILAICLVGPLLEEVLKASGLLWVIEKRPYLLRDRRQILFSAAMSGFCFAAMENFLYLKVYIADPTRELALWRWTICVLLHVGCTSISGYGLARVWERTMSGRTRPNLGLASPFMVAAIVCHAAYNTAMVVLEVSG